MRNGVKSFLVPPDLRRTFKSTCFAQKEMFLLRIRFYCCPYIIVLYADNVKRDEWSLYQHHFQARNVFFVPRPHEEIRKYFATRFDGQSIDWNWGIRPESQSETNCPNRKREMGKNNGRSIFCLRWSYCIKPVSRLNKLFFCQIGDVRKIYFFFSFFFFLKNFWHRFDSVPLLFFIIAAHATRCAV